MNIDLNFLALLLKMHLSVIQGHKTEISIQLCISSQQAQIPEDHCAGLSPAPLTPGITEIGMPLLLGATSNSESDCPKGM